MADALCGPSNPLQSFKNHSQVDRTLQQDRFTGARHSPAQGFRTPDPRAGSLDADFAAFEAGPQEPFHLQEQPSHFHRPGATQRSLLSDQQHAVPAPQWAADFQKLHLGSVPTQPILQNQFRFEVPRARSNIGGGVGSWQNDFLRQHQQHSASTLNGKQAVRSPAEMDYMQASPMSQYDLPHQQQAIYQAAQYLPQEGAYQSAHMEVADEAAFEAAFAQAEGSHTFKQGELHQGPSNAGEVAGVRLDPIFQSSNGFLNAVQYPENNLFQTTSSEQQQQTIRIGSDAIPTAEHPASRTPEQNRRDADELARTAGQLLSSVSTETSAKFEQSQFLALMRRIRDREVEVHGEEFRKTNQSGSAQPDLAPLTSAEGLEATRQHSSPNNTLDGYRQEMDELEALNSKRIHAAEEARRREAHQQQLIDPYHLPSDNAQALHPGGRGYPVRADQDEDPHRYDHWASGGIGAADDVDVDERIEENHGLAGRFRRVTIEDEREGP